MKSLYKILLSSVIFTSAKLMGTDIATLNDITDGPSRHLVSYLDIKSANRLGYVNKQWQKVFRDMTKHLSPKASFQDIQDYLTSREGKFPFYDYPKSVRKIFGFPLLNENLHSFFNMGSIDKTPNSMLATFFSSRSLQEKHAFTKENLLNLDVIRFLGAHPAFLEEKELTEFKKTMGQYSRFLENPNVDYDDSDDDSEFDFWNDDNCTILKNIFNTLQDTASLSEKLAAAESLSIFGKEYYPHILKILLPIIEDQNIGDDMNFRIAMLFTRFGEAYKQYAACCYISILNGRQFSNRLKAAESLSKLGKEYYPNILNCFLPIIKNPNIAYNMNFKIAKLFTGFGEAYQQYEACCYISILEASLNASYTEYYNFENGLHAAKLLLELGEGYKECLKNYYCSILKASLHFESFKSLGFYNHYQEYHCRYESRVLKALVGLGEDYYPDMIHFLIKSLENPHEYRNYKFPFKEILKKFGERYKPNIADSYISILKNTDTADGNKFVVASLLVDLGEKYKHHVADFYRSVSMHDESRRIELLDELGEENTVEFNLSILNNSNCLDDKLKTGKLLARFGETYKNDIARIFIPLLEQEPEDYQISDRFEGPELEMPLVIEDRKHMSVKRPYCDIDLKLEVAEFLATFGDAFKEPIVKSCLFILENRKSYSSDKFEEAKLLLKFEEHKERIVNNCIAILKDQNSDVNDKFSALDLLATFGEEYKSNIISFCVPILENPEYNYSAQRNATKLLAGFGEEYNSRITNFYLSVINTPKYDNRSKFEAAELLGKFGDQYKDQIALFYSSRLIPDSHYSDFDAARLLAGLGEEYKGCIADFCIAILNQPTSNFIDTIHNLRAGKLLASFGNEYQDLIAQHLIPMIEGRYADPETKFEVAELLESFGGQYQDFVAKNMAHFFNNFD